jgi:hypothetical protein
MASKTVVYMEDDIDGGDAAETVTFGIDGVTYEIDLNDKNAAKLRKSVELYVGAARRVGGRKARGVPAQTTAGAPGHDRDQVAQIRAWAAEQGLEVASRGRIAATVVEAWDNRDTAPAPKGRRKSNAPAAAFSAT